MNNTVTLPQTLIKRLEKVTAGSRRTPDAIIRQAVKNQLDYEEWFIRQVEAGMADEKAGRVYSKEEFWAQLDKARHERKKQLEFTERAFLNIAAAEEYIAKDNPAAARKVVETIYNTAEKLESFPDMGKPGRVPGTRELPLAKFPTPSFTGSRLTGLLSTLSCTSRDNIPSMSPPIQAAWGHSRQSLNR